MGFDKLTTRIGGAVARARSAMFRVADDDDLASLRAALHVAQERYRAFFEHGPDGVVVLDPETARIIEFNDRVCEALGYTPEEFRQLTVSDIEAVESPEETRAHIDRVLREGFDTFFTRHRTKQGELRDVQVVVQAIEGHDGTVYHCVWRDVTERERAAESLQQSESRFRALVENAPEAIVLLDAETGLFVNCNEKASRLFGLSRDELFATGPVEMSPPYQPNGRPSPEAVREMVERAIAGETMRFEWVHRNGAGQEIPCEINLTRLPSSEGILIRGSMLDISNRKRAERERERLQAQLAQAQRMESVGRLAGGVAHDFNNMLSVILGHAEMAMDQVDPDTALHDDLDEIRRAADRSAELTRQLLTFARKQAVAPVVLDLNAKVESLLKMMRRLIGENIDLTWRPGTSLWPVRLDPTQLDQILANLCVNARDAITDVGRIAIETENRVVDESFRSALKGHDPGEYVRLSVRDDGCGMDNATIAHIFEPFFTTKGISEGTGLGLATVYGAVKQSGGFIDVSSKPDEGAVFSIYIPRHTGDGSEEERGEEEDEGAPARGRETILLVEDEVAILELARRMIEGLGYVVLPAGDPIRALRIAQDHTGPIHLLMTDVVMPEMNGRDLADAFLALHPNAGCLFVSGYTADLIAQHGILDDGVHFIQKPFTRGVLADAIREALQG